MAPWLFVDWSTIAIQAEERIYGLVRAVSMYVKTFERAVKSGVTKTVNHYYISE